MKAVIFSAVAVFAVVGITLAQDFNNFNNFNNDDGFNNFNDDDEGWGRGGSWALGGGVGRVGGGVSSSWGSSWGGHGAGYGGMGYGYGAGSGLGKVSYIPLPVAGKAKSSGIFETLRKSQYYCIYNYMYII